MRLRIIEQNGRKKLKGNKGTGSVAGLEKLFFTRRNEGDVSHFLLITLWDSIDSVKKFTGENPEIAKYYPEDDGYLLEKEKYSQNYEVFHSR
jgi:hypothetical protein